MIGQTLIPLKEAACMMSVSPATARRRAKQGEIDFVPLGKACRTTLESVQAYIRKCEISAYAEPHEKTKGGGYFSRDNWVKRRNDRRAQGA